MDHTLGYDVTLEVVPVESVDESSNESFLDVGKSSVSGRFLMRQLSAVSFCSVFFVFYCDFSFGGT